MEKFVDLSRIEALLPGVKRRATGRLCCPVFTRFRALLLGLLLDVQLEASLARDLSFRKLCQRARDREVPDVTTWGGFKTRLGDRVASLFAKLLRGLEARNLILTEGRIAVVEFKPDLGPRRTPFRGRSKTGTWFTLSAIGWNLWQGAGVQHRYGGQTPQMQHCTQIPAQEKPCPKGRDAIPKLQLSQKQQNTAVSQWFLERNLAVIDLSSRLRH